LLACALGCLEAFYTKDYLDCYSSDSFAGKKIQSYDIFDHIVACVDMQKEPLADVLEAAPFLARIKRLTRFSYFLEIFKTYYGLPRIMLVFPYLTIHNTALQL